MLGCGHYWAVQHGKRNSGPEEIPIRLAATFAPSRARLLQGQLSVLANMAATVWCAGGHGGMGRAGRRATDSLFVMANHGQLLEYSLDPVPDPSKSLLCPWLPALRV